MNISLRQGRPEDAKACGTISCKAFTAISQAHNFPPDIPSPEESIRLLTWMLTHPGFYVVVAELDGRVIGSNVLDERNASAGAFLPSITY